MKTFLVVLIAVTTFVAIHAEQKEGGWCNKNDCEHWGFCQNYYNCNNVTEKWEKRECGEDYFWEPTNNEVQGGQCVTWEDLTPAKREEYRNSENCLACYWKAIDDCQGKYLYQEANLTNPHEQELSCPTNLVFDPFDNMCLKCKDAKKQDGTFCC